MGSEQECLRADGMREWLDAWVKRTSQRRVSEALGVNREPLRRALQGTGEVTGVLREAIKRYAETNGIQIIDTAPSSSIGNSEDDGSVVDDADRETDEGKSDDRTPTEGEAERPEHDATGGDTDDKAGVTPSEEPAETPDAPRQPLDGREGGAGEASPDAEERSAKPAAEGQTADPGRDKEISSLLGKIEDALTPAELAEVVGAPVLAELPMDAALSGARALARGWRWVRDPAPAGLHGDTLYYLHTLEEVSFADEGAKRVAFAPDTEMFECGLTAAELRYGVHPHQRQKPYAVERHSDRGLLIGIRMAALVPEKPYPDEKWFFGSEGSVIYGERLPSAAEVIAARRKLLVLSDSFPENGSGKRLTPWQLGLLNERLSVELQMVNTQYALTIGEHIEGNRTWAPSIRLGIETRWRHAEIETNEAMIRQELRRRRRMDMLIWLPRLVLERLRKPGELNLDGAVSGDKDWIVTAPPWSEEYLREWRPQDFDQEHSDNGTAAKGEPE